MAEPIKINKIAYIEKSIKTLAWIEKNEKTTIIAKIVLHIYFCPRNLLQISLVLIVIQHKQTLSQEL